MDRRGRVKHDVMRLTHVDIRIMWEVTYHFSKR